MFGKKTEVQSKVAEPVVATAEIVKQAPALKKRSTLRDVSPLHPPVGFDHKTQAGRWVAESRLNARSDGYEPRGFETWKDENGKTVKFGDLVWCYMSKDEADTRKEEAFEAARDQMQSVKSQQDARDEEIKFMLEKAGGKLVTEIEHQ